MNTNDFLPFATGAGADVETAIAWAADPTLQQGFQNGTADPKQVNTVLRQATSIAAMIAQFTADYGSGNVLDNGNIATLEAQFTAALLACVESEAVAQGVDTGTANAINVAALNPSVSTLVGGQLLLITKSVNPNTSAVTQTVAGSTGPVKWADGSALVTNDWPGGTAALQWWDGTAFRILSVMGPSVWVRQSQIQALQAGLNALAFYADGITIGGTGTISNPWYAMGAYQLTPASLPPGIVGTAYSKSLGMTLGTPAITYSLIGGALPSGITLASGVLSGTPTASGSYTFTLHGVDSASHAASQAYTMPIYAVVALSPAAGALPSSYYNATYSQSFSASGGSGSGYTFSVVSGALPAGLSLNTYTGLLSGTTTAAGTASFSIRATDGAGNTATSAYSITTSFVSMAISPGAGALVSGVAGSGYSQTFSASGGSGSGYTYAVTAGALPGGLSLNSSAGLIYGAIAAGGTSAFTVTVTDSAGNTVSAAYSITAVYSGMSISPGSGGLPSGVAGSGYSQSFSASGGTGTGYTFAVSSGSLPSGLSLSSGGSLSGTPLGGGGSFSITATDSLGHTATGSYSIAISGAVLALSVGSAPTNNGNNYGVGFSNGWESFSGSFSNSMGSLTPNNYNGQTIPVLLNQSAGSGGTAHLSLSVESSSPGSWFNAVSVPGMGTFSLSSASVFHGSGFTIYSWNTPNLPVSGNVIFS